MPPTQTPMELIPGWLPPSRENWELIVFCFQFFPVFTAVQWLTNFYPQGKTSIDSRFNLPGKWAWCIMESPTIVIMLLCMFTIPQQENIDSLPWANWTMAGMYCIHYFNRAWLSALVLNPTMSPIHFTVFLAAFAFNTINALSIGGWLAGYGLTTANDWAGRLYYIEVGLILWACGVMGNIYHDDELREIRRSAARRQKEQAEKEGKLVDGVEKLYLLPESGLFSYILFPHYLCEWFEWAAFWLVGGWGCVPARTFLFNEISTMLPRAVAGRQWYVEKFGKEEVGNRKAVLPGLL